MASQLTSDDVGKMKVAELRAELKARDLSTTGLKKELADRLLEHLATDGAEGGTAEQAGQVPVDQDAPAAPETGTDVPDTTAPSGDSTAQTSGEAASIPVTTEQADTENLPSEMPAVPPATEDSVDDLTGAEGTIAQETATEGVETSNEPSEVHRPLPDQLDKTPGFVADSQVEDARQKAEVVPLNETAVLTNEDASHKRKHDAVDEPVVSAPELGVSSVAEQEEASARANDGITADPAAAAILNGSEPEAKRTKTDEIQAVADDIPVPQSIAAGDISSMSVDSTLTNGASSSTFPTSVIPPGGADGAPAAVTLNEAPEPATDFALAGATATDTVGAGQEIKSVPALLFDVQNASSSSHNPPLLSVDDASGTHHINPTGLNNEERSHAQEQAASTVISTHSLNIRGASAKPLSSTNTTRTETQIEQNACKKPSVSSSSAFPSRSTDPTNQKTSDPVDQFQKPPVSRSICISNLVRPFTLPALKSKVEDFGDVDYFWINSIKSHCFITYTAIEAAEQASSTLEGELWPEVVGKPLSVTFLPTEKVATLVQKEEAAGRTRLELVCSFDEASDEWNYDVLAPSTMNGRSLGQAPLAPRGLASSLPLQARSGMPAAGSSSRLDPRNMITATSASGAAIQIPSNSAFAQSRPPAVRQTIPPFASTSESDKIWLPKAGAEGLYSKTKTTPQLYYKAVDKVAAGRRLKQLEAGPRPFERAPYGRGGGRPAPSSSYRDSYRP